MSMDVRVSSQILSFFLIYQRLYFSQWLVNEKGFLASGDNAA